MPLTMNEPEGPDRPEMNDLQPITHLPDQGKPLRTKIILAIFLLLVLGSVVFLVYIFFNTSGGSSSPSGRATSRPADAASSATTSRADTASSPAAASPVSPMPQQQAPVLQSSRPSTGGGRYTIFIASYAQRSDADEEVQRWRDAGYDSFVVEALGHYRVALGRYDGVSEAKHVASELQEAFESGYWIGRIGS